MSDWISWDEAVEVVARDFPVERAAELLRAAILRGNAVHVRVSDQGYTSEWPAGRNVPAYPDYPYRKGEQRPYFQVEDVDLRTLKVWLKDLTSRSEAEPAAATGSQTKARGGGVEKADWGIYRVEFDNKVAKEGFPDELNVKGWRRQADVARWLAELVTKDGVDVSVSTLNRHAKALMETRKDHP